MTTTEAIQKFSSDFKQWRESRAEYSAVTRAVRTEKPREEIRALAVAAGLDGNELSELLCLHARAVKDAARAANLPAATKELARLDAEIAKAEKALDAASPLQQDAAAEALANAQETRHRHDLGVYLPAKIASDMIATAKSMGVY